MTFFVLRWVMAVLRATVALCSCGTVALWHRYIFSWRSYRRGKAKLAGMAGESYRRGKAKLAGMAGESYRRGKAKLAGMAGGCGGRPLWRRGGSALA